jgi:ABC-type proline/glycine betaine transport system substrate-binding protein
MKRSLHTYTAYSIGCAVVWAVILGLVAATGSKDKQQTMRLVFLGWASGWLSATIARAVFPHPNGGQGR